MSEDIDLRTAIEAKVQRLKAHLEAAFAMPSTTHEESRLKRIAIKKAALAIADSCDVVVSDAYEVEEKAGFSSSVVSDLYKVVPLPEEHAAQVVANGYKVAVDLGISAEQREYVEGLGDG